jgi:chromosome partitioning protein
MILTVASFKGGVGKTTIAVHLAAYLQKKAATLLIDGDPNRSATNWGKRRALPFQIVDERQAARYARNYKHTVIDTKARPESGDLEVLASGCDLLILPTTPDAMALEALLSTVEELKKLGNVNYRILLSKVHPNPSNSKEEIRQHLTQKELPLFRGEIRRLVAFEKAALHGVPVYEVADQRAEQAWMDFQRVGEEIL